MEYNDFPGLYKIADTSSLRGQRNYLLLFRFELLTLALAAVVGLFQLDNKEYGAILAILSATLFCIGVVVTIIIKMIKFEDKWYIGRAVAESIKTLSWRYITKGEPFKDTFTDEETDRKFCSILDELRKQNTSYLDFTLPVNNKDKQISDKMKFIRNTELEDRKRLYIDFRVKDQLEWYERKAKFNKDKANIFFILIIFFQLVAGIYSLLLIKSPDLFNIVPMFSTLSAIVLSWLQVKQFQELSQAYSVTAQDIRMILEQEKYVNDEEKFSGFVADTENAFSREHTLWLARKDVFTYDSKFKL